MNKNEEMFYKSERERDKEYKAEFKAADYLFCRWCGTPSDKDRCPKCNRKVFF
jgi:rubrerythrin